MVAGLVILFRRRAGHPGGYKSNDDEGDVVWQSYYDYAQKDDAPICIEIYDESNLEILGASQDANGDWDIFPGACPLTTESREAITDILSPNWIMKRDVL